MLNAPWWKLHKMHFGRKKAPPEFWYLMLALYRTFWHNLLEFITPNSLPWTSSNHLGSRFVGCRIRFQSGSLSFQVFFAPGTSAHQLSTRTIHPFIDDRVKRQCQTDNLPRSNADQFFQTNLEPIISWSAFAVNEGKRNGFRYLFNPFTRIRERSPAFCKHRR